MTRSSSERAGLRLLALLDVAAVELRPPSEFEVPSHPHFAAGRFRFTVVTLVMLGMFLLLAATVFIAMFGSPYGSMRLAGVPVPMILMVVPFGTFMLGLWVLPFARPSLRRRSRKIGRTMFIVGSTPLSRRFLVIDRGGILLVDGRRRRLGSWPRHRVDVTALRPFGNAVVLLIVADDRFFELPISHAVGGPAAPFWSNGGAVGLRELRKLVSRQLDDAGYLRVHDSLVV